MLSAKVSVILFEIQCDSEKTSTISVIPFVPVVIIRQIGMCCSIVNKINIDFSLILQATLLWASYQILSIAGCASAGNAGDVFPATGR